MSLHRRCCCDCCSTSSYSLTTLPGLTYTIACGTNGEYMSTTATYDFGANPPGYGIATRGINSTPSNCFSRCYWLTVPAEQKHSLVFVPRCSSGCGQTWNYYTSWSLNMIRDSSNAWRGDLQVSHVWYSTATGPCAVPSFSVNLRFSRSLSGTNPCPAGSYSFTSFTRCDSVAYSAGTSQSTGTGLPTVTFNALTVSPVVG